MQKEVLHQLLERSVAQCTPIPADIQSFISTNDRTPWALAHTLVTSLIEDTQREGQVTGLMAKMKDNIEKQTFVANAFDIADDALLLLQDILTNPSVNKLFDKDTALPTIYFFVVFVMACAAVDVAQIREYEGEIVRITIFANRLLLNTQIFENTAGIVQRICCKSVKKRGQSYVRPD
jgi:hypothetical protein